MPAVMLTDRALITLAGADAEHFLQNIITTDLDSLPAGEARTGALLSPQGKILFDFLVSRDGVDRLRLDCRKDIVTDFQRRLMLYRLRAKVDISVQDQCTIAITWNDESNASESDSTPSHSNSTASDTDSGNIRDTRFPPPLNVIRHYQHALQHSGDLNAWTALRIANGVVESGADYDLGDAFPHDVLLDQLGGVGFRKGCYVGQEVVSRMQHRGTARRRVLIAQGATDLPSARTELRIAGRPIGTLGSTVGKAGLAIARIDKVKQALDAGEPILAGETEIQLSIPSWATFTFPADTASEEA